ncbi:hypothetical protein TWF281_006915 [Arthrobotrys megalospora]
MHLSTLLPLFLPLTAPLAAADAPPQVDVDFYFSDLSIQHFKVAITDDPECIWVPFPYKSGRVSPRIGAIKAEPDISLAVESIDFTLYLGDDALTCSNETESYQLTLPYLAPGYNWNSIMDANAQEQRRRLAAMRNGETLEQDEHGNIIQSEDDEPDTQDPKNGAKKRPDPPLLRSNRKDDKGDDDDDDLGPGPYNGGASLPGLLKLQPVRPSPEDQRGSRWMKDEGPLKEEEKEPSEHEEEEKNDDEPYGPRGNRGQTRNLQRGARGRTGRVRNIDPFALLANPAIGAGGSGRRHIRPEDTVLDRRLGRALRNSGRVYGNPALDLPDVTGPEGILSSEELNPPPPAGRGGLSQPPNPGPIQWSPESQESEAEVFEKLPVNRNLMALFDEVVNQDANYGDDEELTEGSGEGQPDSPIPMEGNFGPYNGDDLDPDQPDSPVVKKRDLDEFGEPKEEDDLETPLSGEGITFMYGLEPLADGSSIPRDTEPSSDVEGASGPEDDVIASSEGTLGMADSSSDAEGISDSELEDEGITSLDDTPIVENLGDWGLGMDGTESLGASDSEVEQTPMTPEAAAMISNLFGGLHRNKKRSQKSLQPTPTKRLQKRVIFEPSPIPIQSGGPGAGSDELPFFPAENPIEVVDAYQAARNAQQGISKGELYPDSQPPFKAFGPPAAFKIRVKLSPDGPRQPIRLNRYDIESLADLYSGFTDSYEVPDPPSDEGDVIDLPDSVLDFVSRGGE